MSHRETINTHKSPQSPIYSQAIRVGKEIHLSGLIGYTIERKFAGNTIEEQTEQILKNMKAVLEAAGSDLENVIKINIYLTTMDNYSKVNEIYQKTFTSKPPARTCIAVVGLPFNALIEMDAIALTRQ